MTVVYSRIYSPGKKYNFRWKMLPDVLVILISKYRRSVLFTLNSTNYIDSCDNLTKGKEEIFYGGVESRCSLKI